MTMMTQSLVEAFQAAIWNFDLITAEALLSSSFGGACSFTLVRGSIADAPPHVITWEVQSTLRTILHLPEFIFTPGTLLARRLATIMPLLVHYCESGLPDRGSVALNLGDAGQTPGLALSANRSDYFLIPDTDFLGSEGYRDIRRHFDMHAVPWSERAPVAFWRGGNSGQSEQGWKGRPRILMCQLCAQFPDLFDVGISHVGAADPAKGDLEAAGLMRNYVQPTEFNKYRYQIDVDGNSNAWASLFIKLLTGSPVLKVESHLHFRQWYYERLRPWVNFIPVSSDMADLVDKVRWLEAHDDAAQAIGEQGRMLASYLSYEDELKRTDRTIAAALRYFAGQPETELRFTAGGSSITYLREGWHAPQSDGIPAHGQISHIELPRPIAEQDFVLSLDMSPCVGARSPAEQRVVLAANGEVVPKAVLSSRRTLNFRLPREAIAKADTLSLMLLHPDAACMASQASPLDERVLSIVLHGLELTPVSVFAASGKLVPAAIQRPAGKHRATHDLYGPDIWLPTGTSLQQVLTHHQTVLFADIAGGQLRHGPLASSPCNVFLLQRGARAYLLHAAPDGEQYTINIFPDSAAEPVIECAASSEVSFHGFRVVLQAEVGTSSFGLACGGLFLCAEAHGIVTLSRLRLGPWEHFSLLPKTVGSSSYVGRC